MTLEKQIIPLSLATGINTKIDSFQLNTDALSNVENVEYIGINEFRKRAGYKALTDYTIFGAKYENPKSTSVFNKELQLYTDKELLAYSTTSESWVPKGSISNTRVVSDPILRNNSEQTKAHAANVQKINAYIWQDSRGGVRCSVVDSADNTFFLSDVLVSAAGSDPRIEVLFNNFYLFYAVGSTLRYKIINSGNPTSIGVEVNLLGALAASKVYDVKRVASQIFIVYDSTASGGAMGIQFIDQNQALSGAINLVGEQPTGAVNITTDDQCRVIIFYANASEAKLLSYNLNLNAQAIPPTTIEVADGIRNLSAIQKTPDLYNLVYELPPDSPSVIISHCRIKTATISQSAVVSSPTTLLKSVGLASEQFSNNGIIYFLTAFDTQLQATYFMVSETGQIISKISPGSGGGRLPKSNIPKVLTTNGSDFTIVSQIKGQGTTGTASGVLFFLAGVNSSIFSFDTKTNYQQETLGKNLYITGGVLLNYDGATVTEDGFHIYPEGLSIVTAVFGINQLTNGTRQYVAVYMWTDNRGQIHRSAPSVPITYVNNMGANQYNAVSIPLIRLTAKRNSIIELYRTENLGTTFYKVTSTTAPEYNDGFAFNSNSQTISIDDGLGDSQILDREILYTTGGVLENIAAPAGSIVVSWKNRVVLSGLEDQNGLIYSKVRQEGIPVQFNDALTLRVDDRNSQITAMGVLDDKLIIFKTSSLYVESGNGPNNTGAQSDFVQPEQISSDVGCISPDSVVVTPSGLMFQSQKGIYLLDRSLRTTYIGAEVEQFNDLKITSAILVPRTNQVRFSTDSSKTLVYDYYVGRWSVFTGMPGSDSHVQEDTYAYLNRAEGKVYQETIGEYLDNGEQILITFESGWISFAGLQGYQRVYKFLCLGKLFSRHKLRISAAYDFTNAYIHDRIIDSDQFTNSTAYGLGGNYGEQSPYGTEGKPYQFRLDLKKQKCQSIKLKFEELQNEVFGQGLSISGLTFEVGAKVGLFKPNQGAVFGNAK